MTELSPGLWHEIEHCVTQEDTAEQWGSGLVPVFSTPAMVGLMEAAAVKVLEGYLPAENTSVGSHMDVHHLAATPVGMQIHIKAELTQIDGRKLVFKISARDEVELIGDALHERVIVNKEKFITKVNSKAIKS
jgi:fluoroacetyl-CoA thioesterase